MEYLGIAKQALTSIQKGAGVQEKNAIRIAEILYISPIEIMAVSLSLKAKNKEARDMWLKLVKEKEEFRLINLFTAKNGTKGQYYLPLSL